MVIVYYVSGHGLGHASRSVELIEALLARRPGLRIVVRTNAHPRPFERIRRAGVDILPCETDWGVTQIDSLTIDAERTAKGAAEFYGGFEHRVADEARYLRDLGGALVVADIPPLAFAAAQAAGVPSVAVANFTWDWIYAHFPRFEDTAPGVIGTIGRAYAGAALALRLPIHGGFASMKALVRDVPFIARRSHRDPAEIRRLLRVDEARPVVLASFGGYGVTLPSDRVAASGLTILVPDQGTPHGLKHEDLLAAADVVISKPGYGIVSECVAHGKPLVYTSRGRFAEYEVMVAEMPQVLRCRHLAREDLLAGAWAEAVEAVLDAPQPPQRPRVDGASVAADRLLGFLD